MYTSIDELLSTVPFSRDNIKTDSRKVNNGDVFVAIKGTVDDGHDYVYEALEKGASMILCERKIVGVLPEVLNKTRIVKNVREVLGHIAKHVFDDPSSSLAVYGVTGTNGKTTTVFLIDSMLNCSGQKSGLISTVFNKTSGNDIQRSFLTTPDLITINKFFSEIKEDGKQAVVLEISSHALSQQRIAGLRLDSAVVTNITPEHMDYHKSMGRYLNDKTKIFKNLKTDGIAVLNYDDPLVSGLGRTIEASSVITFGFDRKADVRAENVYLSKDFTEFDLVTEKRGTIQIRSPLLGKYNVYNILAAISALMKSQIDLEDMAKGIKKALPVSGRLEIAKETSRVKVFIDYAHTPHALENVLLCLKYLTEKGLICVFGCGGDRDRTKRPVMGQIAARLCDRVILTSDNPRTEDPKEILAEIENGMAGKHNYIVIENRKDAIREAIKSSRKGDIVIIAGKGHEDYQVIGDKVEHFDDKEAARQVLEELGW
ncbi:MAG: UDP-N-acetylmuramoyl-L-alanyl-D-glutamate--2,6-diaminopimelate ligase [Candidatus Omnitrophota bacterium]